MKTKALFYLVLLLATDVEDNYLNYSPVIDRWRVRTADDGSSFFKYKFTREELDELYESNPVIKMIFTEMEVEDED